MHQWIAKVFGDLITLIHILVLAGLIITNAISGNIFTFIAFAIGYLLFVGLMSVFISINEQLGEIREYLMKKNKPTIKTSGWKTKGSS